jgi:class 3 adenylate cyclase/predicted ATPase/DNA-binding IscR family transcriptional regulator/ribosomal protein L40E
VNCSSCGASNEADAVFCEECGTSFGRECPSCGASCSPSAKFCRKCRTPLGGDAVAKSSERDPRSYTPKHLADRILAEQAAMESRGAQDGERKTITALFADIKGSVELMEGIDPEEARAIVDPALQLMMDAVHRYEGYVAQSRGDGIFALFGAPIAQEDHARRALYAALRMQEDIKRYSDRLRIEKGVPLQVRVGLNSGEVVLRSIRKDDLHTDYTPIGHSVNLAARMEGLATPGSIAVAESTYSATQGYFRFRELGPIAVKGISEPVRIYELEGMGALRTRLEVSRSRGFSRFVGRLDEMAALEAALARAIGGAAQVVGIVGEPGVGKSRLCFEFLERCRARGLAIFEAHGVPHGKALPLLPMLELFRNFFGITEQDSDQVAREKIAGRYVLLDESLREALPLVFDLLGISDPERPAPAMDPESRQRQLVAVVKRVTQMWGRRQTSVTFLEDLHWFDGGSEGFLEAIVDALPGTQWLVLVNFRPEYHAAWMQKSYYQQLPLLPLGPEAIADLLRDLLGGDPSLAALGERIRERTGGNPFFIEEVVQALAETGTLEGAKGAYRLVRPAAEVRLPATVHAVLAARIDRLAEREKQVLETAAVVGREFTEPVLRRVVELSEIDLAASLQKLANAEFVYEEVLYPQAQYTFKHALTQEVAYNSLLNERRLTLHERVAKAIEEIFTGRLEEHLSELAHHYCHSRNTKKAIEYSQFAGERAVQLSANAEAISHLTAALKLLETLPDTPERAQQELTLQVALGAPLLATQGWAAPERGEAYARARDLCRKIGEAPELFPVLFGLWSFCLSRGDLGTARELAEQLLSLAESARDPDLLVEGHFACGATLYWAGDFAAARDQLEQGIHLYDPQAHGSHAFVYGQEPGAFSTTRLASVLWLLGYPDRALAKSNRAVALARDRAHPFSLVAALQGAAMVHQLCRETELAERHADAVIALSAERGLSYYLWWALIVRGWAVTQQERAAEGIAEIREGLAAVRAGEAELALPWVLALLAEALRNESRAEEALNVLTEALAVSSKNGVQLYDAEIYRLKGELLASSGAEDRSEAESCFRRAIEIARRQQAKSWELRAVMSLARLLHHQGKKEEARQMLAEIYGWFTEGFDTADLKDAKALLEELS